MAPKAIDARKRFDRNHRFCGHGPLLHCELRRGCEDAGDASTRTVPAYQPHAQDRPTFFRWQARRTRTSDRRFSRMSTKVEPANSC